MEEINILKKTHKVNLDAKQKELDTAKAQYTALETAKNVLESEKTANEATITDAKKQIKNLQEKVQFKIDEIARIQQENLANLRVKENELTTLNGELSALATLRAECEALEKAKNDLTLEKTKNEKTISDFNEEITKLNGNIRVASDEIERIQQQNLENLRVKENELTTLNGELSALKTREKTLESYSARLIIDLQTLERLSVSLNTQLVDVRQKLETSTKELEKLRATNANLEAEKLQVDNDLSNLKKQFDDMEKERNSCKTTNERLTREISDLKKQNNPVFEVHNSSDKPPRMEYNNGFISIFRGWYNNVKLIPKFDSANITSALGFASDPSVLLKTEPKVTALKPADLNTYSSLLFVHSDIVAPHFVGSSRARVLRVCPLRKGQAFEMVHEKFANPLYYRLRTNKIEDVSFTLRDENGKIVNFAPGRVLIGLHLKRFF